MNDIKTKIEKIQAFNEALLGQIFSNIMELSRNCYSDPELNKAVKEAIKNGTFDPQTEVYNKLSKIYDDEDDAPNIWSAIKNDPKLSKQFLN